MAKAPNGNPKPVTMADYEAAEAYLRALAEESGWDFDKFLAESDPSTLLNEPQGPTADCLSANMIVDFMSSEWETLLGAERIAEIQTHLGICEDCLENIAFWQRLNEKGKDQNGQSASE